MCKMCNAPEHHDKSEIERKAICKRERKNAHRAYSAAKQELGKVYMTRDPNVATNPLWQNR